MARPTTPDILDTLAEARQDSDDVTMAMGPAAERISTVKIRLNGGTQPRAGISQSVIDDYYADMTGGAQFPPIEVVFDGTDYWLWDGFHRFHAWRKNGDRAILAHVRQGTRRDAVLLSVGANATHGFRRTNEDKRRAVMALLHDEEWRQWSDREIARRCAVSNQFVSNVRSELSVNDGQIETRRVVRNGTEYTMQPPQRSAAPAKPAPAPEPWIVEELVEELVALESVALDGVDQDWLYEYMQGIATQHNRTFARRDFDFAMRMAVSRQRADNERRERLARAQAAAMAVDAERAAAPFVPVDIAEQVEVETPARPSTNGREAFPGETVRVIDWRSTRGTITEDGRILVQMSDGTKNAPWLELDDVGQQWMIRIIDQARQRREITHSWRVDRTQEADRGAH
jgi:hypothetical protein